MQKADSLDLKFGVFNSDGWSMSGGPWITPEESMKQLVWTETAMQGGEKKSIKLELPPVNLIYHDIATIAFPSIHNEKRLQVYSVSGSKSVVNPKFVLDGDSETAASFSMADGKIPALTFQFDSITSVRRIVFDKVQANNFLTAFATIEYSTDGEYYQKIDKTLPLNLKSESAIKTFTLTFPEIKARYIHVFVHFNETEENTPFPIFQQNIGIGEITFFQSPRIGLWESKSGQSKRIRHDRQQLNQKEMAEGNEEKLSESWTIPSAEIVNLTDFVDPNGQLTWDAPAGNWTILRLGYTSTGRKNAPASDQGRGLECDKMNADATRKHFNGYVAKMNDLSLILRGKPLDFMQMESWEAGIQNWTDGFEKEFEKRNGYSILPWLPVMAGGRVVNSSDQSNRFLWDLRKTVASMMSENYWNVMHELASKKGIKVLGEGSGMQHYLYDPILYHKTNDIPMGEFWSNEQGPRADCKNAASVAHVYGKKLVAAEAFTGCGKDLWRLTPYDFKKIGDEAFALGINQFVLHSYVHQPYDIAPGLTLDQFGNYFQRLNSWYKQADGWLNYIARSQYLLRQGDLVTDVCYFTGEGIPGYLGLRKELSPKLPDGYDYDGVNLEKVKEMTVVGGNLQLPNEVSYSLIVIPETDKMTPDLIREIERLVRNGATVVAAKPLISPSLSDFPQCDQFVVSVANAVWGNIDGQSFKENHYGKGSVVWGIPLANILDSKKLMPDFEYSSTQDSVTINYTHRHTGKSDIYFLASNLKSETNASCNFRSNKHFATIWDADKGSYVALKPVRSADEKRTFSLHLDPLGSEFVVFSDTLPDMNGSANFTDLSKPMYEQKLKNKWELSFTSGFGINDKLTLDELKDWTLMRGARLKYFSGTIIYSTNFSMKEIEGKVVMVDLGEVKNIARVFVNDVEIAVLWKQPFQADITKAIKKGKNKLKIEITNTSINKLIGDEQLPSDVAYKSFPGPVVGLPSFLKTGEKRESGRTSFVSYNFFDKNTKPEPSGLIGPVKILIFQTQNDKI